MGSESPVHNNFRGVKFGDNFDWPRSCAKIRLAPAWHCI